MGYSVDLSIRTYPRARHHAKETIRYDQHF